MRHIRLYENFEEETEKEAFPSKGKAYHLTPDIYLDSIKKMGLTPRTESKGSSPHPERIYLYLNPESSFKTLASALWHSSTYKGKVSKYYLLEIDLTQLPEHRFYHDPESAISYIAVYTNQPIPPSAIRIIQTIPVEDLPAHSDVEVDEPIVKREDPEFWDTSKWDEIRKMLDGVPADKQTIDLKNLKA